MNLGPTLTIEEILELFKDILGVDIQKPGIYYYVTKKGFPPSTGWGKPRKWKKKPVMDWFKKQSRNLKND